MSKKKESQGSQHPTQSFANLVGKAQTAALKPFIAKTIQETVYPVLVQFQNQMKQDREMFQIRLMALENVFKKENLMFDAKLSTEIADIEDMSQGLVSVDNVVRDGYKVRFLLYTQKDGVWLEPSKMAIQNVNTPNEQGVHQTLKGLEEPLIGMVNGEEKEFDIVLESETLHVKVQIVRISHVKGEIKND